MKTRELKKIIQEVISEIMDEIEPKPEGESTISPESNPAKDNLDKAIKPVIDAQDTVLRLTLRGAKSNRAFRKAIAALAYAAKEEGLKLIKGEIETSNAKPASMDVADLANKAGIDKRASGSPEYISKKVTNKPEIPFGPEDWKKWGDDEQAAKKAQFAAKKATGEPVEDESEEEEAEEKAPVKK